MSCQNNKHRTCFCGTRENSGGEKLLMPQVSIQFWSHDNTQNSHMHYVCSWYQNYTVAKAGTSDLQLFVYKFNYSTV